MDQPLKGLVVVALEQAVAAPLCTARLAEAGARVIKIERAEGDFARGYDAVVDGDSAFFVWLNRGKESLVLDIKSDDDRALLERLIGQADIFVQNLSPGATTRAGIGSSDLRARYPRLITCDISGYGEDGPYREMKAYDLLIQCESGLASITGGPEAPGRVGVSIADISCGMTAHAALLQALYERTITGVGRGVAVSLFDTLAEWMTVPLLHHDYGGAAPPRLGIRHPILAPYGLYAAGDGEQVVFAVQNDREWARFCSVVLEAPELATDPRFATNTARVANRAALDLELETGFAGLDRPALIARLASADIAYGALNTVAQLSAHPQLRRVETPTHRSPVSLPAPPVRWSHGEASSGRAPTLNEHGAALRVEFA